LVIYIIHAEVELDQTTTAAFQQVTGYCTSARCLDGLVVIEPYNLQLAVIGEGRQEGNGCIMVNIVLTEVDLLQGTRCSIVLLQQS